MGLLTSGDFLVSFFVSADSFILLLVALDVFVETEFSLPENINPFILLYLPSAIPVAFVFAFTARSLRQRWSYIQITLFRHG